VEDALFARLAEDPRVTVLAACCRRRAATFPRARFFGEAERLLRPGAINSAAPAVAAEALAASVPKVEPTERARFIRRAFSSLEFAPLSLFLIFLSLPNRDQDVNYRARTGGKDKPRGPVARV